MKNTKQSGATIVELLFLIMYIIGIGGWIANIVKMVHMLDGSITAMLMARIVGIFAFPLGCILGFL